MRSISSTTSTNSTRIRIIWRASSSSRRVWLTSSSMIAKSMTPIHKPSSIKSSRKSEASRIPSSTASQKTHISTNPFDSKKLQRNCPISRHSPNLPIVAKAMVGELLKHMKITICAAHSFGNTVILRTILRPTTICKNHGSCS